MAAILGGVGAALCWGTSTFCSSRSTRLIGSPSVLAWVMLVGFLAIAPITALRGFSGRADGADLAWLAVASVGSVAGLGVGYTALRRGKVSIIAPITATEGAIAALIAVAFGEHLSLATGIALAVIVCGIALAATGRDAVDGRRSHDSIGLALVAAVLFGISLYASGRTGPSLGAAAIILGARGFGVAAITLPLIARRQMHLSRRALPLVVASGVLEVVGYAAFIFGVGSGDVAIPAVLSSLFAAIAGILGFVLLGERLRSVQLAGVATILTGVVVLSGLQA